MGGPKDLKKLTRDEMRQLLYPCKELDHAKAFMVITNKLAYQVPDHITEDNPTVHRLLHLEGNEIGNYNLAFLNSRFANVNNISPRFSKWCESQPQK
jgi:hypothetical protein